MNFIKQSKKYKPDNFYLKYFLQTFWYVPSDVLQRGIEASIWSLCTFKSPILDIGVGNGKLSKFLFRKHQQMDVGIDIEESGLEEAMATKKYKKVVCVNAEKMPFKDASFHTVVSNSTFEHITHDTKAVSEVARVLKKGGLFFMTVPSEYLQQWVLEYETKKDSNKAKERLDAFNKRTVHLHYRAFSDWEKQFKKNDLEIVFYKYYFKKEVALYWYKLFKVFTYRFKNREVWSLVGDSKATKFIPKNSIMKLMESRLLKRAYENGFFLDTESGAQLFMVVKKK